MDLKKNRTSGFLIILLHFISTGALAKDPAIKAAAKEVNDEFLVTNYLAKVQILRYGHHYVLPNGQLAPKKKQGRSAGRTIQFGSGVRVDIGEVGESIIVIPKKKEIWIALNKVRGKAMNSDIVHILFNRKVVATDITPKKIANAIASIVEIKGYIPTNKDNKEKQEVNAATVE